MKPKKSIIKRLNILIIIMVIVSVISNLIILQLSLRTLKNIATSTLTEQTLSSTAVNVSEQAEVSNQIIQNLTDIVESAAYTGGKIYENPDSIRPTEVYAIDDYATIEIEEGKDEFYFSTFDGEGYDRPDVRKEVEILSGLKPVFEATKKQCPQIDALFVYSLSGVLIGYDKYVEQKIGMGGYDPEALGKEYYIVPKNTGKTYITDAYTDMYGKGLMITISTPIYANGEMVAIIAADALIDNIYDIICAKETMVKGGQKVLLSSEGNLLCVKDMTEDTKVSDIFKNSTEEVVGSVKSNKSGYLYTAIDNHAVYIMYNKLECGWILLEILPEDGILESVNVLESLIVYTNVLGLVVGGVLFIAMIIAAYFFCKKITSPLARLTEKVGAISGDSLDYEADIETGDEIALLDNKFYRATNRMKEYIENIETITAEKERIGAELNVATQIQMDMLPRKFPPFPEIGSFELYATMDPAKEVGGDFYDFFKIDDHRIGLVMADVSGKGVPAALFMVISKTLVKVRAMMGEYSPAEVLAVVNNQLCEGNDASLFCTCWLGMLDTDTGKMICSSAGHEYPAIRDNTGKFSLFKDPHGVALAALEDMVYQDYEITLAPGDAIFVYTDGVPEATNAENQLFEESRMIDTLNISPMDEPEAILRTVKTEIDKFVGDAPQFDDITMLCLHYKG